MENVINSMNRPLKSIENQSNRNNEWLTRKSPIKTERKSDLKRILNVERKIELLYNENEFNQEFFLLYQNSYFCVITKAYDEAGNQYVTMLTIYACSSIKNVKLRAQLLPQFDNLIDFKVVSADTSEKLVFLVDQSNGDKIIKILSFNNERDFNSYDFKTCKLEGAMDTVIFCTIGMNIFVISVQDEQNSLFYKLDMDAKIEEKVDIKHNLTCTEKIFAFSADKIGIFNRKMLKIDFLNVINGKIINNQQIDLSKCNEMTNESFVYFDSKSRLFLFDDEAKAIKVFSLNNCKLTFLFELLINLNDDKSSNAQILKLFIDDFSKKIYLIDSLNTICVL